MRGRQSQHKGNEGFILSSQIGLCSHSPQKGKLILDRIKTNVYLVNTAFRKFKTYKEECK
jgi:hypothetical protein